MSARAFWTILLKLLGVYIILQLITGIPTGLNFIISMEVMSNQMGHSGDNILMLFIYLIVLICIFWFLIYATIVKAEWTIDKLKLDKGIEEKLNINMHRSDILKIVIMVIGGLTLVDSLPILCRNIFDSLEENVYGLFRKNPNMSYIIVNFIRTAFGIFMLTSSRLIVNYIEKKRREPVEDTVIE